MLSSAPPIIYSTPSRMPVLNRIASSCINRRMDGCNNNNRIVVDSRRTRTRITGYTETSSFSVLDAAVAEWMDGGTDGWMLQQRLYGHHQPHPRRRRRRHHSKNGTGERRFCFCVDRNIPQEITIFKCATHSHYAAEAAAAA